MRYEKRKDDAVSPVVGVMLMLVVTIIIAAVVSAYSGGLVGSQEETPSAVIESLVLMDKDSYSTLTMRVTSTSEPIPTSQVKLITEWTATNRTSGEKYYGGGVTVGTPNMTADEVNTNTGKSTAYNSPSGFGAGISGGSIGAGSYQNYPNQWYGAYTLTGGTTMTTTALSSYRDKESTSYTNCSFYSIFGPDWDELSAGDYVDIKLVYIPTGGTIYSEKVPVNGGV